MNEFGVKFNLESPQKLNTKIVVSVDEILEENLLYKFFAGLNGKWNLLRDFSKETTASWEPAEEGSYSIMVQARNEGENRPFKYISKVNYVIGEKNNNLITAVALDKKELTVGEKIFAKVETSERGVLYKYSIKQGDNWQLLKDYSASDTMFWTAAKIGKQELVVQCKLLDSKEKCDDIKSEEYNVLSLKGIEIKDFKCLTEELLKDSEISFQVDVKSDESRLILYKFIKIDSEGKAECIQNYSTKRIVSYTEKGFGEFKILCMVKDMYSMNEYDERAIIFYKVKKYISIKIKSFTSDVTSPQLNGNIINLKAIVSGGKELLYRYIIEGKSSEDSGYIRSGVYNWKTKEPGTYKIKLYVKDISFDGTYEDSAEIEFLIDEVSREPVVIREVITDKKRKLLVGETINIKVIAEGGTDIKYSFLIKQDNKYIESISYGSCNWVNYTPEKPGDYELEVRVKDKFSDKEFDAHSISFIKAFNYIPAQIDYVLMPSKDYYMVGDKIELNIVEENTNNIFNKYILRINGHKVEETEYINAVKYSLTPKYAGVYNVEVLSKNKNSSKEYDDKRIIKLVIHDSLPVTNTIVECNKIKPKVNENINFSVRNEGGKEVVYEFYLMEKGEWNLVQKYSRKSFYTFIPFTEGKYQLLVLCKNQIKKQGYEDYAIIEFDVEK